MDEARRQRGGLKGPGKSFRRCGRNFFQKYMVQGLTAGSVKG